MSYSTFVLIASSVWAGLIGNYREIGFYALGMVVASIVWGETFKRLKP